MCLINVNYTNVDPIIMCIPSVHLIKDNCIFFSFQTPVIPLYLGADLFSNTDIRTENHPRHHAKFAKKGLATKVNFSSGDMFDG